MRLLPIVADTALLDFNLFIASQAKAVERHSPEACVELFFPTGKVTNAMASLPKEFVTRELEILTEMIRTSDSRNARRFSTAELATIIKQVLGRLTQEQIRLLASGQLRAASPKDSCDAVIAYLNVMNDIPKSERARSLRAVYSSK
jgi:hypothetical protein